METYLVRNRNLLINKFMRLSKGQSFYDYRVVNVCNNLPVNVISCPLLKREFILLEILNDDKNEY